MSRKYSWAALLLAVCSAFGMVFSGCGLTGGETESSADAGGTATVYYLSKEETQLLSLSTPVKSTGDQEVKDLFQILTGGSFPDGKAAVPADLSLDQVAWQDQSLILYLTGNYPQIGTRSETLCRAALVKTMLRATGAEGVQIYINGQPLCEADGTPVGEITADAFLDHVNNDVNQQRHVSMTLYYADATGTSLVQQVVEKDISIDTGLEEAVMQQLIEGPKEGDRKPVIAPTTSVLGISVRNRTCYVNLSEEFINQALNVPEILAVYAIVNSLTELPEVDQVQIAVEGSSDIQIADNISLAAPLVADYTLVSEWAEGKSASGSETPAADNASSAAQTTAAPAAEAAQTAVETAPAGSTQSDQKAADGAAQTKAAETTPAREDQKAEGDAAQTTSGGAAPAGAAAVK